MEYLPISRAIQLLIFAFEIFDRLCVQCFLILLKRSNIGSGNCFCGIKVKSIDNWTRNSITINLYHISFYSFKNNLYWG